VRKAIAVGALIGVAALAAPAFGGDAETSANKDVKVGDNFFKPRSATINRGDTVTWKWVGKRRHNVRFSSKSGRPSGCGPISGTKTGKCKRAFKKAGTFGYQCTLHGSMTGKVKVD
jgi:plastocyanin